MLPKSILLLAAASTAFAAPQDLAAIAASLTSELGIAIPTDITNINDLTSGLNLPTDLGGAANSLLTALSGLPTLPASIQSVLATAVPISDLTKTELACEPTAASWYNDLPNDVKSALTSYGSALQTWASANIGNIATNTNYNYNIPVCTGSAAVTKTGTGSTTQTGTGTTTRATTGAGGAATSAGGNAVSTTNSPAAAPRATGAIMGTVAGIVGIFGVMVAL